MPTVPDSCAACRFSHPLDDEEADDLPWGCVPADSLSCRYVEAGPTVIVHRPIVRKDYLCALGEASR